MVKLFRSNIILFALFAVLTLLGGCSKGTGVASIKLSEASVSLQIGESRALSAIVQPSDADYDVITWSSSDPSVASVTNGMITANSVGTTKITAIAGGKTSSPCVVTVQPIRVTAVTISSQSLELSYGETYELTAVVVPPNATDSRVSWKSDNPEVVTVSENGKVTAVSSGVANISVTTLSQGITAICKVTVAAVPVESVNLSESSFVTHTGETYVLTVSVSPSFATNQKVMWSSDNPEVATVDESGIVTAVSVGKAIIKAVSEDQGKSAECQVTVEAIPVEDVSLSESSITIRAGEVVELKAQVSPDNATNKQVVWKSVNPDVAVVSESGTVTGVSIGETKITVKTVDQDKTAECQVIVERTPVESVSPSVSTLFLKAGETFMLGAEISPSTATNKAVVWQTDNPDVALVSESGEVTAVSVGDARIIAVVDGVHSSPCVVTVERTPVSGVSLSKSSLTMGIGESAELDATIEPSTATCKNLIWSSDNPEVVVVNNGVINAQGTGKATIICASEEDESILAECVVTVKSIPISSLRLDPESITLDIDEKKTISAIIIPSNASDKTVHWSSESYEIASVDDNGTVTGHAKGTTRIIASAADGTIIASCAVKVIPSYVPVDWISLETITLEMSVGESYLMKYRIYPDDATNQEVIWKSGTNSVATVSQSGLIKAVSEGTAYITATTVDGGKSKQCKVTVNAPAVSVSGVSLSVSSLNLSKGQTERLTYTISPSSASNKNVTWSSSDESVATVTSDGTVTAKAAGSATITCTTDDGSKKASCSVTVTTTNPTLSFKPQMVINGMKGFEANSFVYRPLYAKGMLDSKNEYWAESGEYYSESTPTVLTYNVSPSSFSFDNSYEYSSAYSDVSTRTYSSEDFSISLYFRSYVSGQLSVIAKITGKEAYDEHMTTVALQVSKNGVTYTSDYAAVSTIRRTPFISGLPSSISSVWTSEIDRSSSNIEVAYNGTIDLKTKTVVKMVDEDNAGSEKTMSAADMESAGLSLEYEVVKNYMVGSPVEDQGNYADLDGSVLIPRSFGSVPTGGRTPIIRVKLMHNGDVIGVAYHKVFISQPASVSVTGVSLDKSSLSLDVGNTATLTATVSPSNATNKAVTWSSSNTSVATVSTSGVVTAKAAGSATITVKTDDGGKMATCKVTVSNATIPVTGVSISPASLSLTPGQTSKLTATISPSNATNTAVSWTSSNTSVATVASDGTVTAKAAGSATITCTTQDGNITAKSTVTVAAPSLVSLVPRREGKDGGENIFRYSSDSDNLFTPVKDMASLYSGVGMDQNSFHVFYDEISILSGSVGEVSDNVNNSGYHQLRWTLSEDELWQYSGREISATVRYYNSNFPSNYYYIDVRLTASVEVIIKWVDLRSSNGDYEIRNWTPYSVGGSGLATQYTATIPSSSSSNPNSCQIVADINASFVTTSNGKLNVDGIDGVDYYFCKRDMEAVTKIGNLWVEFRVDDDYDYNASYLYARINNGDEEQVASIINNSSRKTISGISAWNHFVYNKNSEVANTLLNSGAMYLLIGADAYKTSGRTLSVTFDGSDHFQADILRPIEVATISSDKFDDGVEFGQPGSYISIADLINLKDWRLELFSDHDNYWNYYGPFRIYVDVANAQCEIGGKRTSLPDYIKILQVEPGYPAIHPETGEQVNFQSSRYGYLTYYNSGEPFTLDFRIFVKVKCTYGFGEFYSDWISIPVSRQAQQ